MTAIFTRFESSNAKGLGVFLICCVCFLWGFLEVLVQHIPGNYPIYQIVWMRYATHLLFMVLMFGPRLKTKLFATKRLKLQLLRSIMMLIMPVSYVWARNYMSAQNILSIFWLLPSMVLVLAVFLLREQVSWVYWLFSIASSIFLAIILHPDRNLNMLGVLLALIMGLSFGSYVIMTRMLRMGFRLANLFYTAIGVVIPLSFGLPAFWQPLTFRATTMMVGIGLIGFIVLWLLDKALELTDASTIAPVLSTQMLWILVISAIVRLV